MRTMSINKRILLSIFALLVINASGGYLYAGGENRAGTSAAPELLIPTGARYLAMGGSPVAIASGVEAIFWDPAGLDRIERSASAMFSYRSYIADISFDYFAVGAKFDFGSLGLSLRSLNIGDIPITTETAPDGTGGIFNPTYFVLGFTYSKQLTDRIGVGININMISETMAQVNSSGMGLDVGVQYHDVLAIPGLDVGVAVKNIGPPMRYGGSGLLVNANVQGASRGNTFYSVSAAEFDLPSVIEIGLAYRLAVAGSNALNLTTAFQNNNYAYDEYRIGGEYNFNNLLFLRAGYLFGANSNTDRPDIFQNYTLGAGISIAGNPDISVDYAFVPVKYFTNNQVVALRVGF